MVHEALQAQTSAITALTEELKAQRAAAPKDKPADSSAQPTQPSQPQPN